MAYINRPTWTPQEKTDMAYWTSNEDELLAGYFPKPKVEVVRKRKGVYEVTINGTPADALVDMVYDETVEFDTAGYVEGLIDAFKVVCEELIAARVDKHTT